MRVIASALGLRSLRHVSNEILRYRRDLASDPALVALVWDGPHPIPALNRSLGALRRHRFDAEVSPDEDMRRWCILKSFSLSRCPRRDCERHLPGVPCESAPQSAAPSLRARDQRPALTPTTPALQRGMVRSLEGLMVEASKSKDHKKTVPLCQIRGRRLGRSIFHRALEG